MKTPLSLKYTFTTNYKLRLEVSDPLVFFSLKQYLKTYEQVVFQTRGKRKMLMRELKVTELWEQISDTCLSVDAGLIDYLFGFTKCVDKSVYDIQLELDMPRVEPIQLSPKWEKILRPDQKEDVKALTRFYGGLAAQHTGYGKTLCMLAIIESLLPERSLILVPSSGLIEETQQRGEQFGVEISHYKWTESVNIINPMGFLRSKEAENPHAVQWLDSVKYIFTDEAHHLQAMSWDAMFSNFLTNVVRSYGFSASPDVKKGEELSPISLPLSDFGHRSAKILGLSGSIRVRRRSPAGITLVKVRTEITPESMKETLEEKDWQFALDTMMCRPFCAQVIAKIIERFPKIKFYIPIHKITSGLELYKNLALEGIQGIFWSEKQLYPEMQRKNEGDLAFVKRQIILEESRFLMTTSVGFEGIDIPALAGIIPLVGTSYRMTIQPAGRSVRGGSLVYVMIYDKHNKPVEKQMNKRLQQIRNEYDNIERSLSFRIV